MKNIIRGKWNKNIYYIDKYLGEGSIGHVYKVSNQKGDLFALKVSEDILSITKEYKMMSKFSFLSVIPKVYELDDGYIEGEKIHFILMEYIEGAPLKDYLIKSLDIKSIFSIAYIIADAYHNLYKKGYIYWDVKLENILVDKKNEKIRIIDFGGVSKVGQSIKEYTPTYNINCWSDKFYKDDRSLTFSISMIIISLLHNKEYNPLTNKIEDIIYKIRNSNYDSSIKRLLINGLIGNYSIGRYIENLKMILQEDKYLKNKYYKNWIDTLFWGSIGMFIVFIIFKLKEYIV